MFNMHLLFEKKKKLFPHIQKNFKLTIVFKKKMLFFLKNFVLVWEIYFVFRRGLKKKIYLAIFAEDNMSLYKFWFSELFFPPQQR